MNCNYTDMGQKFYLESVDIKCTYTPIMILCRRYPQNFKVLLGVSPLP